MPPKQAGVFLATILQVTCSFRQEMDNMATSQVFLLSQIIPTLWGACRGLLEGLSLLGPPSCPASWPASLVEWVTAVPTPQVVLGFAQNSGKTQHSCIRCRKSNSGIIREEITSIHQANHWVLERPGERKRGCRGPKAGRKVLEKVQQACTVFGRP